MNLKYLIAAFILSVVMAIPVFAANPVDINTADAQTLADGLQGIGLSKAEAIIAYRQEHGAFKSVDELANVKGIGEKTIEHNRAIITVGNTAQKDQTAQQPALPSS